MKLIEFYLSALGYDKIQGFDCNDQVCVRELIYWLQRNIQELRESTEVIPDGTADSIVNAVIEQLGVKSGVYSGSTEEKLQFVLQIAIDMQALQHEDSWDKLQQLRDGKNATMVSVDLDDFHQRVLQLVGDCGVSEVGTDGEQQLRQLSRAVSRCYGPLYGKSGSQLNAALLHQLSSMKELVSQSEKLDHGAVRIARSLFVLDLEQLQTLIDRGTVRLQNMTANPETDNTGGQVGR